MWPLLNDRTLHGKRYGDYICHGWVLSACCCFGQSLDAFRLVTWVRLNEATLLSLGVNTRGTEPGSNSKLTKQAPTADWATTALDPQPGH